jgi:hypothetical protein
MRDIGVPVKAGSGVAAAIEHFGASATAKRVAAE